MNEHEKQYAIDILSAMAERTIKRLWVIIIIQAVMIAGMIGLFIWRETQFEDVVITAEQQTEAGGNNYAIGGDFDGTAEGDNQAQSP